jgi:hypothetical protein
LPMATFPTSESPGKFIGFQIRRHSSTTQEDVGKDYVGPDQKDDCDDTNSLMKYAPSPTAIVTLIANAGYRSCREIIKCQ